MLQISNLDEGKADWISETQLIIPMVENEELQSKEIDGIPKHTITLNALEGTDQTLLTNVNGHTFVIGLDRNLFENYGSKSDLLLMPNSDLKLLQPDSKLTYSLPPVEQSKNDIIWENNAFEKPLAKDILNVIHETSKGWSEIDKASDLCLEDINNINENKVNSDFLIEPHLVNEAKKLRSDNTEYVVGYYPLAESCDVIVPASLMTLPQRAVDGIQQEKPLIIGNDQCKSTNELYMNDSIEDTQPGKWMKIEQNLILQPQGGFKRRNNRNRMSILKMNNTHETQMILTQDNNNKYKETVIPLIDSTNGDLIEAKSKDDIIYNDIEKCMTKDEKCDAKVVENDNNSLPEQSLPLKKKAKMKKSVNGNFNLLSADGIKSVQSFNICGDKGFGSKSKSAIPSDRRNSSDTDEPLSNARKKPEGNKYNFKKKKKRAEDRCYIENGGGNATTDDGNRPYETIMDVLNHLKTEKYINDAVHELLRAGLQEMNSDVLEEMYSKRDSKGSEYSSQLKAFALMLHFKQPTAFNRLGELFQNGWPPLSIIKDWKRRLNNRRPKRCEQVKN